MQPVQTKSIFVSKTTWFGTAQILLGLIGGFTGKMDWSQAGTLIATGMGTIGFRFSANQPVSLVGGIKMKKI